MKWSRPLIFAQWNFILNIIKSFKVKQFYKNYIRKEGNKLGIVYINALNISWGGIMEIYKEQKSDGCIRIVLNKDFNW